MIDTLERAYDAWNRRDVDGGLEFAAPDMEWHGPADSPFAGPHRGHAQIRRFAEELFEMFDRIVRTPKRYEIHGEHVLVEVDSSVRGAGSGVEVAVSLVDVWTVRDRLCVRYAVFGDMASALDYIARGEPAEAAAPVT